MRLAPAAALALALLAPGALGQGALKPHLAEDDLEVRVFDGLAHVRERLVYHGPGPALELRVPSAAREVQAFLLDGAGPRATPWSWSAPGLLAVAVGTNASGGWVAQPLLVGYSVPVGPSGLRLEPAPSPPRAALRVAAQLPGGWVALADGERLPETGPGTWSRAWTPSGVTGFVAAPSLAFAPVAGPSPLAVLGALLAGMLLLTLARAVTARGRPRSGEMGLLGHLGELQARLRVLLLAVAVLMVFLFSFALVPARLGPFEAAVPVPSLGENIAAQTFRLLARQFTPEGVELIVVSPVSGALVQVEVALFLAILLATPLLAYEAGAFLMPALLPRERSALLRAIPAVTALFVVGALFAYALMVPTMMRVLYSYAEGLGARPFLAVDSLVSFAIVVTLVFGLAFELPVLMVVLARLGVASPRDMAARWRHVVVGLFVLAAVITPDPSVVSQVLVALPLLALYGAGIVGARLAVRAPVDPAARVNR